MRADVAFGPVSAMTTPSRRMRKPASFPELSRQVRSTLVHEDVAACNAAGPLSPMTNVRL